MMSGLQVQALFQAKGGDVLVAQMVAAVVALPGQVQEGGHDVGHHPVDVEGQGVQGDGSWRLYEQFFKINGSLKAL